MRAGRLVLLIGGSLLIVGSWMVEPGLEQGAFILGCCVLGVDLLVGVTGPLLATLRQNRRNKPVAEAEDKMVSQAPIPDTVKQRARDVKRRLGGETIHATDRRTALDEERRRRGL